jgi:hypothetical protein
MGSSLRDLNSRQLERLKSELAEVIITNFCYPSFLDYRLNILRTRPVDRRKRREVWAYVNSIQMNALGSMDASSIEFRRFVERVFLRYIEINRGLIEGTTPRQFAAMRARVPQLAMQVARSLIDYLALGEASSFGRARPVESWAAQTPPGSELTWEQIEKSTQLLQTTLVYLRTPRETGPTPAITGSGSPRSVSGDISNFPTRFLTSSASAPLASVGQTNGASAGSGNYPSMSNGAAQHIANGSTSIQPTPPEEPGEPRQFLGPTRSRTASRPIDGPLSLPSLPPRTGPTEPAASSLAPPSKPAASQPASVPSQPLPEPQPAPAPLSKQPVPAESSLPPADAWQALLWPGTNEQTKAGADAALASPAPTSEAESAPTEADLLELPESFNVPPALELPPDLAELYGDYLRDARAGLLETSSDEPDTPAPAGLHEAPPVSPTLALEPDEELDSLFDALANHIAAGDASSPSAARQEPTEVDAPQGGVTSSNSEGRVPSNPLPTLPVRDTPGSQEQERRSLSPVDRPASAPLGLYSSPEAASPESRDRSASGDPIGPPAAGKLAEGDVMIFAQLQHQVTTWVKMAAVSHQIEITGRDALDLVAELRRMAALDEAELQVIEALVSLCQRVTTSKQAAMDDYKQAMMLYLLHHRSRLAL